ncbi:uncharacterized protein LOC144174819 [Haemaphysalis longicornis]
MEKHQEPAVDSSDGRDDEASNAGRVVGPDLAEGPDKAPEEADTVAAKTSEDAAEEEPDAVAPGHPREGCNEGVVGNEEGGALQGAEPTPQPHSSKDIGGYVLGAHSAFTMTQKCPSSLSVDSPERDLDFEANAPPESPSPTSLFDVPDKGTKEEENKLEEGEAEDDGEVSDISGVSDLSAAELLAAEDDLEEGELPEGPEDSSGAGCGHKSSAPQRTCRFFNKGQCTWGSSCRFIHPGINDRGNYNMFASEPKPQQQHHMPPPAGRAPVGAMRSGAPPQDFLRFLGPPMPFMGPGGSGLPPIVSAWERGLQHAKELKKRASRRKEQEPDFEEKRLNLVPSCHDQTQTQDERDKENDFYKTNAVPLPFQGAIIPYVRPFGPPAAFPRPYRGGRRGDDRREEFYGSGYPHGPRPFRPHWGGPERDLRWHEERFPNAPPPPMARSRPDEWRDPWRRSKTPAGHRGRSKSRNRRSPSSCSSMSISSLTSTSSYSYSRSSSSQSSYSSYDSRSRSRSPAVAAPTGRPRGNQPTSRRSLPYAHPSQVLAKQAGKGRFTGGPAVGRSPALHRRKSYKPSPSPITTPSPLRMSRRRVTRSSSSRTPSRSHSQSLSRSPSLTTISSASSSPVHHRVPAPASAAKTQRVQARNPSPAKKMPEGSKKRVEKDFLQKGGPKVTAPPPPPATELAPPVVMPGRHEPLEPTLDLCGFEEKRDQLQAREALLGPQGFNPRPQIKLTLIKKTLPLALPKKEELAGENSGDQGPFMLGAKKRPASPKSPTPPRPVRKPAATRREELLKQLKAVEDAIARKRAKFS